MNVSVIAARKLGIIRKASCTYNNDKINVTYFRPFVLPLLEYCSLVWMSAAPRYLSLLDRVACRDKFLFKRTVTQPLYESRMNWIHDPAPPTSRRPNLEFAGTPAPAIAKEFPGALSTQPKQKKSRRRRRRKASKSVNQNAARHSAAPVTSDDRWANRNTASQRVTRPKSAANDPQEMRSTPVYSSPSFHSSHVSQPPIPAANENAGFPFDLDRCEFFGLYKPAQIDPRQDLTATPTRVNSSGLGISSPAPKQPSTKPISGLGKLKERGLELCTRCCPAPHAQTPSFL